MTPLESRETLSTTLPQLNAVRTIAVLVMAAGYASTMGRGPGEVEWGRIYGVDPSLLALQVLFFLSGFLALRSLDRHGSALAMLKSRGRRNLPLLAIVTALVAFVVYPILAAAGADMSLMEQFLYLGWTVSCLDPGQPMPGILEEAHYACLLQGAIWTFRWGLIAYLATATLWKIGLLRNRVVPRLLGAAMVCAYAGLHYANIVGAMPIEGPWRSLEAALGLTYPFTVGLAAFAWCEHLPRTLKPALLLITLACVNSLWLPWTPAIGIAAALAFCWLAFQIIVHSNVSWLRGWPDLALPLFLVNWPLCQILLWRYPGLSTGELIALTLAGSLALAALLRAPQLSSRALSPPPLIQAKTARTP